MSDIKAYYEDFARRFVNDYVQGNERVGQQCRFLSQIIPTTAERVLILGCGSGQVAYHVASKVTPHASIIGVDISSTSLRIANALFRHERIAYRQADVTQHPLIEKCDFVILPDVYEHIPRESRKVFHSNLNAMLSEDGTLLLTVPSAAKQASLYASGQGLQVVDEIVSLDDLIELAKDVDGELTYFNLISVWERNDYVHAAIQRKGNETGPIVIGDRVPMRGWPRRTVWLRGREFLRYRWKLGRLSELGRRWRARRHLARNL